MWTCSGTRACGRTGFSFLTFDDCLLNVLLRMSFGGGGVSIQHLKQLKTVKVGHVVLVSPEVRRISVGVALEIVQLNEGSAQSLCSMTWSQL